MTVDRALSAVPGPADIPAAPGHLARSRALWVDIAGTFDLEQHQYELLLRLCEASDRADQARDTVAADGLTITDRYGQTKPHPAVNIERDARLSIARLLRELRLDEEREPARAPRGGRRSRG